MKVTIFFGSKSDTDTMKKAAAVLREFGVDYSSYIISAHRAGELLAETVAAAEADGTEVIIAGAGLAAHLPGVIASMTVLPVIGVPLDGGKVGGLDALLSIVQMPKQIPVATVGLDNAANAAYLACEILAIKYPELKAKLKAFRAALKQEIAAEGGKGVSI
ncbi:5-(carboxyamino)imidazole ribonucleotide mutase [Treponema zuelzerae]|uniref:N5-carboxyaminoimidazole ribonucleotide mutase n=1 Tax=Teretinema zuelzerae TaxID=156 RepID=A0AAE3JI81_9SPIR|nr:5-(carboxyamino)imidazole ribonucleotide mutase [Teretinema zuelzerae]MBN2811763.1 5-(carboxyamino)imidazole ribonucleotide mutase [Spirochaetales bacterium]MCD1653953.1 5-(carboxyamino)imidazole ribonucleotide mutase [Teretinema zuelzerae]HPO03250.1 5-(carboxyamino)imidazole ribonucleotide mutase [Treponemataceae bacterium]